MNVRVLQYLMRHARSDVLVVSLSVQVQTAMHIINFNKCFSTHLLTVLTKRCIVIVQVEQKSGMQFVQRGGAHYEFNEIYAEINTIGGAV